MKTSRTSKGVNILLAGIVFCVYLLPGCHKNPTASDSTPTIVSFSPAAGTEEATVTIKGKNFDPNIAGNTVKFNGFIATVTAAISTELTVKVPVGATTGKISVTVGDKTASSLTDFTVNPFAPLISSFIPDKGDTGTLVEISGNHFTNNSKVYFDVLESTEITFVSATKITAKVPANGLTGKLKVICNNLEAISNTNFSVKPRINSFTPAAAYEQDTIILNGANFSSVAAENAVRIGTVAVTEITEASASRLKVKVPAAAQSGNIFVKVLNMEGVSSGSFVKLTPPSFTGFSPTHGDIGSTVTITGQNLAVNPVVKINNINATIVSSSATEIKFTVPANATAGRIVVQYGSAQFYAGTGTFTVTNIWERRAGPFSGKYALGISWVYNNKLYFGLGASATTTYNSDFKVFDPSTNTWSQGPVLPSTISPRTLASCFVLNNKVYLGNGYTSSIMNNWYEFDPLQSGDAAWRPMTSFPNDGWSGGYGGVAYVINNIAYAGTPYFDNNKKLSQFDPTGNSGKGIWTTTISPIPDVYISSFFTIGNYGYICGGGSRVASTSSSNLFYRLDPVNKQVTRLADFPLAISLSASFSLNGKGYIVTNTNPAQTYEYNTGTNTWANKNAGINADIIGTYNAAVVNGKAYAWTADGIVYEYIASY